MMRTHLLLLALGVGAAAWLSSACSPAPARSLSPSFANPLIRRGDLEDRFILTGELRAVKSLPLVVPATPDWEARIQWLGADGAPVKSGEVVAQLDNSSLLAKMEDQRLALAEAEKQLQKARADTGVDRARKRLEVLRCRVKRDQARLDAEVPESTVSRREYQERQLALAKAEAALEKASREMESYEKSSAIQVRLAAIAQDQARRGFDRAESTLGSLTLRAPADGILIVSLDNEFDRKWQVGDSARPGQVVAEIPDLRRMQVEATLSDVDDGQIAPGLPARCRLDAYADRAFAGTIASVGAVASGGTSSLRRRFFRVLVTLEQTDAEIMRPGMSVKVEVVRRRWEGALLAPRSSLNLGRSDPELLLSDGRRVKVALAGCGAAECALTEGPPAGTFLGIFP
jgi:HlyD family secretion protein